MTSNRKLARRYLAWRRYAARNDQLVAGQRTFNVRHAMRTNPGFYRAHGAETDAQWALYRHGA